MTEDCIFCRIARKEFGTEFLYEDAEFVAFRDLHPQAPVHLLLIPKQHYPTMMDVDDPDLFGRAMRAVQRIARQEGVDLEGFRTVVNCRDNGGQTVYHLHIHILGGRFLPTERRTIAQL